jgi:nucleotide-binding universal stress UspA family protein
MSSINGIWGRLMAPVAGVDGDMVALEAAAQLAAPFEAEVAVVYAPADISQLTPWMGDGFMGGVPVTALDTIRQAGQAGERAARGAFEALDYERKSFTVLASPVWSSLSMESRLSDLAVFNDFAAKGRGPLAEAFQQIVADEQRPTLVVRPGLDVAGCIAVAWDGGKEASRAARTAIPLLRKARNVVILAAPTSAAREFDPDRLRQFLGERGVKAEISLIAEGGEAAPRLLAAAKAAGAGLLVAGAFGHPRLQEFIFGGATRSFLNAADGPSLFLSH